eukprot:gb/GECG01016208.1/.p1 GENE.gb/GECG01016208.1/~~gb/GECG01016208.1/.p1  ORF type:complete len:111 (+),score=5.87 gb/GECG01016208.1/:1-333(+)
MRLSVHDKTCSSPGILFVVRSVVLQAGRSCLVVSFLCIGSKLYETSACAGRVGSTREWTHSFEGALLSGPEVVIVRHKRKKMVSCLYLQCDERNRSCLLGMSSLAFPCSL